MMNLLIMIVMLTLCKLLLLPSRGIVNSLQCVDRANLISIKIQQTAKQEVLLKNSSNALENSLSRIKNIDVLNQSTSHRDTSADYHDTTSWNLSQLVLEVDENAAKDVFIRPNEIDKSNQENNSKNNQKQTRSLLSINRLVNSSTSQPPSSLTSSTSSSSLPQATSSDTVSTNFTSPVASNFEHVEMNETLAHMKNEKFLLHRNKRYLLFPAGSSFQLVFDLIIPIVDYTNFALMGITCAIAWELPSKPPSEIIENFRHKLNDGTFGLSRRNDSTLNQLDYINSPRTEEEAVDSEERWREGIAFNNQHYSPQHHPQPSATIAGATSEHESFLTSAPQPPLLLPSNNNFYYNSYKQRENNQQPTATSATFFHGQQPLQQQWRNTKQRKTLYTSRSREGPMYRNDFADKWKAKSWLQRKHQQPQQTKLHYGEAGPYWNKNKWWDRQKNPNEKQGQENETKWPRYQENPQMPYQTTMFSKRTSRNRKILYKPPKHRIYPIFGKRRRRHSSAGHRAYYHNETITKKLQDIHIREHLRTRQKLYGKIEKLYKTRGQNGTACVLRALCETERIHLNSDDNETPQSFVMELLRSIFALPKDTLSNSKDMSLHLDDRYTQAVLLAHDVSQSCSRQYHDCEYSITYGAYE